MPLAAVGKGGLVARRGRGARLYRAHANPVPALADGQRGDAGGPSAVGRGGANLGIAELRRRVLNGRQVQLDPAFRPGAPRYALNVKVIQLDIAPEEIGHNKSIEVPLVGDRKAIVGQLTIPIARRPSLMRRFRPFVRVWPGTGEFDPKREFLHPGGSIRRPS
jgi:hypothetical protein